MLFLSSLSEADAKWWLVSFEIILLSSAVVLTLGLIGEWPDSEAWKERIWHKLAKAAVIFGVVGELLGDAGIFETSARLQTLEGLAIGKANSRAADAQLALLKFREPRRAVLAKHEQEIIEKLKQFRGTRFDTGLDHANGEEADFLRGLGPVLREAGWVPLPWDMGTTIPLWIFNVQSGGDLPRSAPIAAINVEIRVHAEESDKLKPAADALISALNGIGIVATDGGPDAVSINKDAIHIWIGEKR